MNGQDLGGTVPALTRVSGGASTPAARRAGEVAVSLRGQFASLTG